LSTIFFLNLSYLNQDFMLCMHFMNILHSYQSHIAIDKMDIV